MDKQQQQNMNISEPDVSFLSGTKRQSGMTLPEGFFADFEQRMQQALDDAAQPRLTPSAGEQQHATTSIPTRRPLWIGMAAAVLLALCVSLFLTLSGGDDPAAVVDPMALSQESELDEDQEEYLMATLSDYDMYDYYCDAL